MGGKTTGAPVNFKQAHSAKNQMVFPEQSITQTNTVSSMKELLDTEVRCQKVCDMYTYLQHLQKKEEDPT